MGYVEEKSQLLEIWVYRNLRIICRKVKVKTLEMDTFVQEQYLVRGGQIKLEHMYTIS